MTAGRESVSKQKNWCTPEPLVSKIHNFFNNELELDPCSNSYSLIKAKKKFYLPKIDGLKQEWNYKSIYVNPPYGNDKNRKTTIKNWIGKCCFSNQYFNSEVIALIPVATNTSHWKEFIYGEATSICFLYDTRLKFNIDGKQDTKGAPMSCCLVYWGKNFSKFDKIFSISGAVLNITNLKNKKIIGNYKKNNENYILNFKFNN